MKKLSRVFLMLCFTLALAMSVSILTESVSVSAATVKISAEKATMIKGETKTLKVTGTRRRVTWSSNKKSVATVNEKGVVTAKAKGTATITAKVSGRSYACKVTVESPSLSKKSLIILGKGKTSRLKLNGTSRKVTWSSNKKSVATVNEKGVVTAKAKGTAAITAKVSGKSYTCKVTVETPSLSKTSLVMLSDSEASLKLNGTSRKVRWSTSDEWVVDVDEKGNLEAYFEGTATITASVTVSGKTYKYTCKVTVEDPDLEEDSIAVLVGESTTLKMTGTSQKVTWISSNPNIAAVTKNGTKCTITGKAAGTAKITASVSGVTFNCDVTVISLEDNCKTLNQYINEKGKVDEDGNKYIKATIAYDDVEGEDLIVAICRITYLEAAEQYRFEYSVKKNGVASIECSMTFNPKGGKANAEVNYWMAASEATEEEKATEEVTIKGTTEFDINSYNIWKGADFVLSDFKPSDSMKEDDAKDVCSSVLMTGTVVWDYYLDNKVKFGLQDLGFIKMESYEGLNDLLNGLSIVK
jgi:uncharacterized protein YjdB